MSLSDYWIGDHVLIISKNIRGRFEGIDKNAHALVKTTHGILSVPEDDLQPSDEPEADVKLKLLDDDDHKPAFAPIKSHVIIDDVIDLHYEKLAPERQKNPHPHIIEFQIEKCREYLDIAILKKFTFIRIIHGRGQGKLKAAVEELLKEYPQVNLVSSTPDLGALEIWLK